MQGVFRCIIVSCVVYLVCAGDSPKETVTEEPFLSLVPGLKIENVVEVTRVDNDEESFKLTKREMELQNVTEGHHCQTSTSTSTSHILDTITTQLEQGVKLLVSVQQEHSKWHTETQAAIAENQARLEQSLKLVGDLVQQISKMQSEISNLRKEATSSRTEDIKRMQQLERNSDQIHSKVTTIERMQLGSFRACKDIATTTAGIYTIRPSDTMQSFLAYCTRDGWMYIQRRFDGNLNFNRNWDDYKNGFGEVDGEMWMGLERLHQMTKHRAYALYIRLTDYNGIYKDAHYTSFAIGSEAEGYNLKTLGAYSGTAGDMLKHHKGMKFSTPDRDNDGHANANCAKNWLGGWWFNACYHAFLNGLQQNVSGKENAMIGWFSFHNEWRGLRSTFMIIRPVN